MVCFLRAAAVLTLGLALAGCANANRPISLEEFNAFCWPAQIDYNCPDDNLCQDFKNYLAQDHAGKDECVAGCLQLGQAKSFAFPLNCAYPITNATDWCESYCRRTFDAQQQAPSQGPSGQEDVTVPVRSDS